MALGLRALATRAPRSQVGVFVLGTNNSGTSAVTRVINLLGVPVNREDDMLFPTRENPKGYWESARLARFHDKLYAAIGGDDSDVPPLRDGWEKDWRLRKLVGEARLDFRYAYGDSARWVWKDPRTSITFPFWLHALQPKQPLIVAVHRNPLAVAQSLEANHGIDKIYSLHLWRLFNERIIRHSASAPTIFIAYEALLADPFEVTVSLAQFLSGFALVIGNLDEAAGWIEPGMNRHDATREALLADPDVQPRQRDLYDRLWALSTSQST